MTVQDKIIARQGKNKKTIKQAQDNYKIRQSQGKTIISQDIFQPKQCDLFCTFNKYVLEKKNKTKQDSTRQDKTG